MNVILAYPRDGHDAGEIVDVDDATGHCLIRDGVAREAPADLPLEKLTVGQLHGRAGELNIDTIGLRKADIIARIRGHQPAPEATNEEAAP